jgi:MYXO-CTERM domain-containing protein
MNRKAMTVIGFLLVGVLASTALGGVSWVFQDTTVQAGYPTATSLGFYGGGVWPVIFSENASAMLLPTGWQQLSSGLVGQFSTAASSLTGQVAATGISTFGPFGQGVVSTHQGWASLPISAASVAYNQTGQLYTADLYGNISYQNSSGTFLPVGTIGNGFAFNSISIAVDSLGDIGVVTTGGPGPYGNDDTYYAWSPLTGAWSTRDLVAGGSNPYLVNPQLAFDSKNRPHVVGEFTGNQTFYALDYNVVQNLWVPTLLPYSEANLSDGHIGIASDGQGGVGTAYFGFNSTTHKTELVYGYKGDGAAWVGSYLVSPTNPTINITPGIAYDYQSVPAIAYVNNYGDLALAYDPPTPEPASLTLLALGGLALLRRRR